MHNFTTTPEDITKWEVNLQSNGDYVIKFSPNLKVTLSKEDILVIRVREDIEDRYTSPIKTFDSENLTAFDIVRYLKEFQDSFKTNNEYIEDEDDYEWEDCWEHGQKIELEEMLYTGF